MQYLAWLGICDVKSVTDLGHTQASWCPAPSSVKSWGWRGFCSKKLSLKSCYSHQKILWCLRLIPHSLGFTSKNRRWQIGMEDGWTVDITVSIQIQEHTIHVHAMCIFGNQPAAAAAAAAAATQILYGSTEDSSCCVSIKLPLPLQLQLQPRIGRLSCSIPPRKPRRAKQNQECLRTLCDFVSSSLTNCGAYPA